MDSALCVGSFSSKLPGQLQLISPIHSAASESGETGFSCGSLEHLWLCYWFTSPSEPLLEERSEFSCFPLKFSVFRFLVYWVRPAGYSIRSGVERNVGLQSLQVGHCPVLLNLTAIHKQRIVRLKGVPPLSSPTHWEGSPILLLNSLEKRFSLPSSVTHFCPQYKRFLCLSARIYPSNHFLRINRI